MQEPQSLSQTYDKVKHLIPNYEWTTLIDKSNDLIHIPTKTILSYDLDGYRLTVNNGQVPLFDYEVCDFVPKINDPKVAVAAFVLSVLQEAIQEALENY